MDVVKFPVILQRLIDLVCSCLSMKTVEARGPVRCWWCVAERSRQIKPKETLTVQL